MSILGGGGGGVWCFKLCTSHGPEKLKIGFCSVRVGWTIHGCTDQMCEEDVTSTELDLTLTLCFQDLTLLSLLASCDILLYLA